MDAKQANARCRTYWDKGLKAAMAEGKSSENWAACDIYKIKHSTKSSGLGRGGRSRRRKMRGGGECEAKYADMKTGSMEQMMAVFECQKAEDAARKAHPCYAKCEKKTPSGVKECAECRLQHKGGRSRSGRGSRRGRNKRGRYTRRR